MPPESQNPRNLKSCFLNLSYTSGGTPSRIEQIITGYFEERGFKVKSGRMAPAGEQTDKGILRVIKSCGFGIVVYNEFRHNISYEWGLMDALGMPVIPFLRNDAHIDIDRDFSDKKATTFVVYFEDSEEEAIIKELENNESLKSAVENIERLIAEQISSEETVEANEASKLLIESNMPLGEFGEETKVGIENINEIINSLNKIKNLTVEGHFNKATAYYYAKKYEDAEKELRVVLQINPDDVVAHSNLGVLLEDRGRHGAAEEEYREAIRADPDYVAAHYNLGNLLDDLKRHNEAEKEYREAIRADPEYAAAHSNLGNLLKDQERYDDAEKEYREAIRADPDYSAAHFNLGVLLKDRGRYDDAEKEYREAIRADPGDAAAHSNLGVLLEDRGRHGAAEEEYREAIRADPGDAAAHSNLGNLLKDQEQYDDAETEYRDAIRADPDLAEAHGNLGSLCLITERPEDAKKEFEIAKELFEKQGRGADAKMMVLLANT